MVIDAEGDETGLCVLFAKNFFARSLKLMMHSGMNGMKSVQLHMSIVIKVIRWASRLQKHIFRQSYAMTE